ncbi:LysR family transcriptional regulator [Mameliella alba]|nr:LysR family transcriptional regulator [Mameliella alba]MBY6168817.1 LysR family transcriptional regulator [Mameliella alba]MBY6173962.1 LysR family transcriptional regulator [Mameliella alba]
MNINSLDLNLLRVMHTMAQERSVSRTADRLGLSQPAVSNALRRLRQTFGDELYLRGKGGMTPTPRAEELARPIAEALSIIETALIGDNSFDPSRIVETITITSADAEILLHGADILSAFQRAGFRAPVQFLPLAPGYRSDELWRNRLAIAVTTMLYAPEGLKQRKAYDEHLVCLMRSDHAAAGGLDLETYLDADHLLVAPLGGAPSGFLDAALREQGLSRNIRLITHSFGSAAELVRGSGLIASIPSRQAARHAQDERLTIAPLPITIPPYSTHLFWSERFDNDPVNKWLRKTVHAAMTTAHQAGTGASGTVSGS